MCQPCLILPLKGNKNTSILKVNNYARWVDMLYACSVKCGILSACLISVQPGGANVLFEELYTTPKLLLLPVILPIF